jgi:hypothetical protein
VRDGTTHASCTRGAGALWPSTGAAAAPAGPAHCLDGTTEYTSSSESDDREDEALDALHRTALQTLALVADRRVEARARRSRSAACERTAAAAAALQAALAAATRTAAGDPARSKRHMSPVQGAAHAAGPPCPRAPACPQGHRTPGILQAGGGTVCEAYPSATSGHGEQICRTDAGFSSASQPMPEQGHMRMPTQGH